MLKSTDPTLAICGDGANLDGLGGIRCGVGGTFSDDMLTSQDETDSTENIQLVKDNVGTLLQQINKKLRQYHQSIHGLHYGNVKIAPDQQSTVNH